MKVFKQIVGVGDVDFNKKLLDAAKDDWTVRPESHLVAPGKGTIVTRSFVLVEKDVPEFPRPSDH